MMLTDVAGHVQEEQQLKQPLSSVPQKNGSLGQTLVHSALKKAQVAAPAVVQVLPICMPCTGSMVSGAIKQGNCL